MSATLRFRCLIPPSEEWEYIEVSPDDPNYDKYVRLMEQYKELDRAFGVEEK